MIRSDTGTLPGGHPYVSVGSGDRALVVLPGVGDAMFSGRYPPYSGWALAPYFGRFLDEHTVYVLSRPRGLPAGYDADDAVETHVAALESLAADHGGVDAIGISVGGLIGQELARRAPELVDRLVVANAASRVADDGRPRVRRLERYARDRDWASVRSELAVAMFTNGRAMAYPPVLQTVGRFLQPRPADPADVWRSLEFALRFDAGDRLGEIDQPALVFGGERDPFYPERLLRETADGVPNGRCEVVSGAKHGAFHERKHSFDSRVARFLEETTPRPLEA